MLAPLDRAISSRDARLSSAAARRAARVCGASSPSRLANARSSRAVNVVGGAESCTRDRPMLLASSTSARGLPDASARTLARTTGCSSGASRSSKWAAADALKRSRSMVGSRSRWAVGRDQAGAVGTFRRRSPDRGHQPNVLDFQPAGNESNDVEGRTVQPLRVVHDQYKRYRVSHVADELKGRDRNTERIRRVVDAQPECGLEDLPLRLGLLRQSSDDRAQELVQARKSYLGF